MHRIKMKKKVYTKSKRILSTKILSRRIKIIPSVLSFWSGVTS